MTFFYASLLVFVFKPLPMHWGLDVDNHKTTTRYILFLCQNSISWLSYKQKVVSKSNTETKYQSVVATLVDIKWATNLLHDNFLHLHLRYTRIILVQFFLQIISSCTLKQSISSYTYIFFQDSIQQKQLSLTHFNNSSNCWHIQ